MKKIEKELWNLVEKIRSKRNFGRITPLMLSRIASLFPSPKEFASYIEENDFYFDDSIYPFAADFVKEFIGELIKERNIKSVLDPWANLGEMLSIANKVYPNIKKTGYVINEITYNLNTIVNADFEQVITHPLKSEDNTKYDLIISNLPIGMAGESSAYGLPRSSGSAQIIIRCLDLLSDKGVLIVTASLSFFHIMAYEKFRTIIQKKGYSLKAIFGTPPQTLLPATSIPIQLLVIEKGEQEKVFVAEITDDTNKKKTILKHFKKEIKGKTEQDGVWQSINDLASIPKLVERKELDLLLRRTGLPLLKLSELGEIKRSNTVQGEWIAIHRSSRKNVELGQSPSSFNENQYYFFEVNTQVVETKYLIELLNSSLGKKILQYTSVGISPTIIRARLLEMEFPIDSIQAQQKIIKLDRELKNLEESFKTLRLQLWDKPKKFKEIQNTLKRQLKTPNNVEWFETLPFPLSSILWGYHSEAKTDKKVEYLLLFFEGFCQFLDTLILSAIIRNNTFYENEARDWVKNEHSLNWYEHATFGGWQKLLERLSKNVRTLYHNKDQQAFIINLFGGADESYFKFITSKSLAAPLMMVNQIRNNFKGHGGLSSSKQKKNILKQLDQLLYQIKEIMVEGFSNMRLIRPTSSMSWDRGTQMFTTTCQILKGTRTQFRQIEVQTNSPMDEEHLYIIHNSQFTPIELLPFVQMRESPKTEQNACYFYNRIDKTQVRFVSYHFDKEAEVFDSKESINEYLELLGYEE